MSDYPLDIGASYGYWTVVKQLGLDYKGMDKTLCKCVCGKERELFSYTLIKGISESCGCKQNSKYSDESGGSKSPEYRAWLHMIQRCLIPETEEYENYGGRGIAVCAEWLKSFENFFRDVGKRPNSSYSLGRENNDGNYCPLNVRWMTREEQANNTSRTIRVTIDGVTKSLKQWCLERMLPYDTIYYRVKRGWNPIVALSKPIRHKWKLDLTLR